MLIKESNIILPETLQLLELLQADVYLKDFFLVGGTALALQLIPLKALTCFDDIDPNIGAPIIVKVVSFKQIQSRLIAAVSHPKKIFNS